VGAIEAYKKLKKLADRFEKEARCSEWVVADSSSDASSPSGNASVLADTLAVSIYR
jgi:hypothetical protein